MSQDDSSIQTQLQQSKSSKVKRATAYDDSNPEIVLEPVPTLQSVDVIPTTSLESSPTVVVVPEKDLDPSTYVIDTLVQELTQSPNRAIQLVQALGKITRGWEALGSNGVPINEVPVPPGKNPKDFVKTAATPVHVSGFRLTTIFGDEVANIIKDSPKWRVTILGEYQVDTPFVQHSAKAEFNAKQFAEAKLRDRGYIIGN